jgi:hypothetical protein
MIASTVEFIKKDYATHPLRLLVESLGMGISLGATMLIAATTPFPPMLLCYVLWEIASALLLSASYSRGSTGLVALYSGFLVIDAIGLARTLLS